jgi:pimeloyl-ACP methyl ester carboxylesterase
MLVLAGLAGAVAVAAGCNSQMASIANAFDQGLSACRDLDNGGASANITRPETIPNVKVVLLRGLADVWSVGLNTLTEQMQSIGLDASVHSGPSWSTVGAQLAAIYDPATGLPGIVAVGHSYGSDDAIRMAEYLKSRNIPVRLLILLDATSPPPIPDNVDRCLHLYNLWLPGYVAPGVFSGNPVSPAPGNTRTIITNEVVTPNPNDPAVGCVNHFNIDASSLIHQRVIEEILKLPD